MANDPSDLQRDPTNNLRLKDADARGDQPLILRDAHGSPYLVPKAIRVTVSGQPPSFLTLYPGETVTFGRQDGNTVVVKHDSISREQGKLSFRDDGRWVYRDLGSRNGSFLSEFIDPQDGDDVRPLEVGRDHVVAAGQCLVFANKTVCVSLLADLPAEAKARAPKKASAAARKLESDILDHANHDLPVLLLGPSGSGKTYVARRIHEESRQHGQFVLVNCGRLPQDSTALHSELLGHHRGAYTGAEGMRLGRIQSAQDGTLFLDELESMPKAAQDFLLDLLDGTGSWAPLGADPKKDYPKPAFRLISASKVPLRESNLREDLQYRLLRGGSMVLPTLEARREDIPELVAAIAARIAKERSVEVRFNPGALRLLEQAEWPGQIRELEGVVELVVSIESSRRSRVVPTDKPTGIIDRRLIEEAAHRPRLVTITAEAVAEQLRSHAMVVGKRPAGASRDGLIEPITAGGASVHAFPARPSVPEPARKRPEDLTATDLRQALEEHGGNKTRTAQALGIAVNTLKSYMAKRGVS